MIGYGKMSGCAVSALSALAERHSEAVSLSSAQIAELRNYSQVTVAKVLTLLSQAGIVIGNRGPGGGYRLARKPEDIHLIDIVQVFENVEDSLRCPFGPGYCGDNPPCPMHERLVALRDQYIDELSQCSLALFVTT